MYVQWTKHYYYFANMNTKAFWDYHVRNYDMEITSCIIYFCLIPANVSNVFFTYLHDIKPFFITSHKHTAGVREREGGGQGDCLLGQTSGSGSIVHLSCRLHVGLIMMWYCKLDAILIIYYHLIGICNTKDQTMSLFFPKCTMITNPTDEWHCPQKPVWGTVSI